MQQPDAEYNDPKRGSEPKPDERPDVSQLVDEGVWPLLGETREPPTHQEGDQADRDGNEDDVVQRQHQRVLSPRARGRSRRRFARMTRRRP